MQVSNPNPRRHLRWPPSLSLLFALLVFAGLLFPRGANGASFEFLAAWGGLGTGPGQFNSPSAAAVDAGGDAYVADSFNHRVQTFDSCHRWTSTLGSPGIAPGQFNAPLGAALDSQGNLYVADANNNRIQVFDPSGAFLAAWGGLGTGPGQFRLPVALAIGSNDDVYVVDTDNSRVQVFDAAGGFLRAWGKFGSGNGQFNSPFGIAVDPQGRVYVADTGNNRIQAFDSTGAFVAKWGSQGSAPGQLRFPVGVSAGPLGEVYVAEGSPNHRIQVFGDPPPTIGELLESVGEVGLPHGIENSLKAKLRGAEDSFERSQLGPTANKLGALLAEIAALSGKKLDPDTAAALTEEVEATLRAIACLS